MILIVDDEIKLAAVLQDYLRADGFETYSLHDGRDVMGVVRQRRPQLILLDVMLPGIDGLSLCRSIKAEYDIPVLLVTARGDEIDRIAGLELGADDYICKPFSPREVVARVKARLRDHSTSETIKLPPKITTVEALPGLTLDEVHSQAVWREEPLILTPIEFRLLQCLAQTPGLPWTRTRLLDRLYDDRRVVNDRTVDSHVKNLRRKLPTDSHGQPLLSIDGVYGRGYRLVMTS